MYTNKLFLQILHVVTKGPLAATSGSTTVTKIDLGTFVKAAEGSWDVLR